MYVLKAGLFVEYEFFVVDVCELPRTLEEILHIAMAIAIISLS